MPERPVCSACERPVKTCLCDVLVTLECHYRIIILQDPTESRHALSSAPLLKKSIRGSQLIVGEVFDPEQVMGADWLETTLLIYPGESALSSASVHASPIHTLVFLDGTWKKVARLLHLNPWLNSLPRFALTPAQPSAYRIRKSPRKDGLSTLEAAVCALNVLQPEQDFSSLLSAFHRMIDFQINAMGETVFKNNYSDK